MHLRFNPRTLRARVVPRLLAGAVIVTSMIVSSCSDRDISEDSDAPEQWRFCTYAAGAYIVEADGRMFMLFDPVSGGHSKVCLCMTPETYELQTFHAQINDMTLEACLDDARAAGYAEDNTCEMVYESGLWAEAFDRERTDYICEDDGAGQSRQGCGVE